MDNAFKSRLLEIDTQIKKLQDEKDSIHSYLKTVGETVPGVVRSMPKPVKESSEIGPTTNASILPHLEFRVPRKTVNLQTKKSPVSQASIPEPETDKISEFEHYMVDKKPAREQTFYNEDESQGASVDQIQSQECIEPSVVVEHSRPINQPQPVLQQPPYATDQLNLMKNEDDMGHSQPLQGYPYQLPPKPNKVLQTIIVILVMIIIVLAIAYFKPFGFHL
jgi:hypothetical protein